MFFKKTFYLKAFIMAFVICFLNCMPLCLSQNTIVSNKNYPDSLKQSIIEIKNKLNYDNAVWSLNNGLYSALTQTIVYENVCSQLMLYPAPTRVKFLKGSSEHTPGVCSECIRFSVVTGGFEYWNKHKINDGMGYGVIEHPVPPYYQKYAYGQLYHWDSTRVYIPFDSIQRIQIHPHRVPHGLDRDLNYIYEVYLGLSKDFPSLFSGSYDFDYLVLRFTEPPQNESQLIASLLYLCKNVH